MLSLGVNIGHDRGAALVKDGEVLCAVSLERLDRNKHSVGVVLPYQAMEYCLRVGNYAYADLDVIVYNYPHHNKAYPVLDKVKAELLRLCNRVVFVPHHLAHAYSVFYASPFDESVVLVCDGAGNKYSGDTKEFYKNWHWGISANEQEIEAESAYYFTNEDKKLTYKRWQTRTGNNQRLSLGRMYWEACKHIGMGIFDGGKLMGLAPYGKRLTEPLNIVKQNGGDFSIDLTSIKSLPSGSFEENAKTAWIIQNSLEETLVWLANMLYQKNPFPNICISGGVGLNSVSNERVLRESPFENIFVAPASNDSGVALGCAYFGYYQVLGGRNRKPYKTYAGREYGKNEIVESLEKNDGQIECRESSNLSADAARLIADEKIVAWFQGGSEYGPRALGNRSILCDPRRAETKDILNDNVKHREAYRPFAPSVLYEEAARYFDVCGECPYMLQIVDVLEHKRNDLAAITHVDGTARIQTLRKEQNPKYYDLIKVFGEITGIPVVLNTSFNIAGEPIVETPDDALRCFLNTNIDVLVMGNFIVQKTKAKEAVGTSCCTGRSTRKRILLATSATPTQLPFSTTEKRDKSQVDKIKTLYRQLAKDAPYQAYQPIPFPGFEDIKSDIYRPCFDRLEMILHTIGDIKGKRILDIGCNVGFFCFELAKRGAKVLGVDSDSRAITIANMVNDCFSMGVDFQTKKISGELLQNSQIHFDVVLFLNIFHWYVRNNQQEEGYRLVQAVSEMTDAMFFETGQHGPDGWQSRIPPMEPSPEIWIREDILSHSAFNACQVLGQAEDRGRVLFKFSKEHQTVKPQKNPDEYLCFNGQQVKVLEMFKPGWEARERKKFTLLGRFVHTNQMVVVKGGIYANAEYNFMKRINHPLVPKVYDYDSALGAFSMEVVSGKPLNEISLQDTPFAVLSKLFYNVCDLMCYLRNLRILTYDVWGGNVIFQPRSERVSYLDFERTEDCEDINQIGRYYCKALQNLFKCIVLKDFSTGGAAKTAVIEVPKDTVRQLPPDAQRLVEEHFASLDELTKTAHKLSEDTKEEKKRVLLVTSAAPTQSPFSTTEKRPPIGIGFLISVLRNADHKVFFIDNYLQPNNFLETDYLQEHQIDYVGIYANTICFRDTLRMLHKLEHLRQTHKWNGKIIVGGPHTTVAVDTIPDFVDYVVQGEGERAILDIVEDRVSDRIVSYPRIENLDVLPMPAWDCFVDLPYDWSIGFFEDKPVFTMNTSRGCPFNCTFCSVGSVWGKKYTYFSAERIVSDIEYLIKHYGLKGVYFREDNFTLNKERLRKFCNLLIEKGIKICWTCESRVSTLSRDLVELMSRAGAKGFYFGVESGSQRILDFLHKDITVEQIKNAFNWCHEFNIKTAASLIVGVPGETESDRQKTHALIKVTKPDVVWANIFVGIPDSNLYHFVLNNRLYQYIDDRGLLYLQGHNSRVKHYYSDNLNACIPDIEKNKDMTIEPKVSVLISVYNGERFIEQALKSIYNQTYQNFEVVIVDDGSTDKTADILFNMKDSRTFIYRNSENRGLTKSLNTGLKLCRGEYIARMDADDVSYPQRFEKQVRFLDENPDCTALGCWCNRIDSNGQIHGAYDGRPTKPEDIKRQLLIGNCIAHPTAMVRRVSLVEVGGYNEKYAYAQDHDLWLRLSKRGQICNLNEYLVGLRFWPENITATKEKQQLECSELAIQEALQRRKDTELATSGNYLEQESDWKPRFSIMMANYNNAEYIAEATESVLSQTFKDWELIIVDDCSTDNSSEIINQYLSDKRIRMIQHERNRGYIAALKTGIEHVRAEHFGILDSDDCLTGSAIETMYSYHVRFPDCGLIYSQFMYCHEDLTPRQIGYCNKIPADKTNLQVNVVSGFKTFKMRDYLKTSGYDEDILYAEDKDIIYKMEEVTQPKFVDQCLYLAREIPNSQSHNPNKAFIGRQSHEKAKINALRRRGQLRSKERDSGTATINLRARYTLGSSYLKAGKYSEAQITLEPILTLLMQTLEHGASQLSGLELEKYNMMAEYYLSVCTKLAQCYMKQEKYDKVEQIYSDLLNNQYLALPEGQKAAIHAVLAKIRNIKLPALSTEHSRQNPSSKDVRESEPLVSVYIVTYNMERFIRQAIDSALAQTCQNLELLVVDDGSTDGTKQIVESYSDDRIRYIYKPHKNFASGMNMAISEAKGEYLIGVDSDDFIATDYIEKLLNCARRHPEIDYFYPAKLVLVDESGNPTGQEWDHLDFSDNSVLPAFLFGNGYSPIPNSPSLKRKSLFGKVGLYEELDTVEDFVFLCKNALRISFKRVEQHSTYFYRRTSEGNCYKFKARNQITARALNDMISMYPAEVLYPQIAGINDPALRKQQYYKYLMMTFYKHVNGHMVRYGEYFQQYGDYYKEKLLNHMAKTNKAVSSVDGASAQDDLLRSFKQGVERLKEARPQDALVCFDKACRLGGKVSNLQYARAVALMQLGRCNDARLACEAELAVQPDHRGTQMLLNKISQDVSIIN